MTPLALFRRRAARPAPSTARSRLRVEALEGRDVPATLLGLTAANTLVAFDSATPSTLIGSPVTVTGLAAGETLIGIDYRPANGLLYGVGSTSRVYTLDAVTGVATAVGPAFTPALSGSVFGVNFNPVADRLRVVSDAGQSLRIVPATGVATADAALTFDPNDATNQGYYGTTGGPITPAPQAAAAAYTLNFDATLGINVTTLYAIDPAQDILFRIGGPDGSPSPNTGLSVVVDQIRNAATFAAINFGANVAFDIEAGTDAAFAVNGNSLYSLNITTAAATPLGTVGGSPLLSLAVVPPAAGAGVLQLSTSAAAFGTDRKPIAVTVTRTGGASAAVTVNYTTADGTAVAGVDYLPNSGTLSFAAGVTSQTIFLLVPAGPASPSAAKTFTLTLSAPGGGATLGGTTAATVTIPQVVAVTPGVTQPAGTTPVVPTRFYAAGSSGGRVAVYDANGGGSILSFAAFGGGFGGAAVVAVGDLNADGFEDLVVGAGSGGGPRVTVYDGKALSGGNLKVLADFFAFGQGFTGGVSLAAGDVNGDGRADLIVGAGAGGGPRVLVFDGGGLARGNQVVFRDFFAFQPDFFGGVNVAAGELTGDGLADIVVGASAGGGPRVVVFDGRNLALLASFFAYGQGFTGGVSVAVGDLNGDGRADVLTGAGSGGGPRVTAYEGRAIATGNQRVLADYFAFQSDFLGGVNVAARDVNRDGFADPITGAGPTGGPRLRVVDGRALLSGRLTSLSDQFAFGGATGGGLNVG